MTRRRFVSAFAIQGFPGAAAPVVGSMRRSEPFRRPGPFARPGLCDRRAPPCAVGGVSLPPTPAGGSPHGVFGVGDPLPPPPCPQSAKLKLAPSPPVTYSIPSGPNLRSPTEWLGYCWLHWLLIRTCGDPTTTSPDSWIRMSFPVTTQPSVVGPGGVGHASFHLGAVPPGRASYVYSR